MFRANNIFSRPFSVGAALMCMVMLTAAPSAALPTHAEFLIDPVTGAILHSSNADATTQPASLTKMMTLYMTFDALDRGDLTLDQSLAVSQRAQNQPPSKLGFTAGSTIRVEDAILGLVTRSANDAAVVLAEAIGGSEENFAREMTAKANILGMRNTTFRNASGLPNPNQLTTARDVATLAKSLIEDHPRRYAYFSRRSFIYNGAQVYSHNRLMLRYEGMDGLKTGFVNASGFNLAASAVKDGRRLIAVVLGGNTARERDNRVAALLDDGFGIKSAPKTETVPVAVTTQPKATVSRSAISKTALRVKQPEKKSAKTSTWTIQVGAFKSLQAGKNGLATATKAAPAQLKGTSSMVTKGKGQVFQARFTGLTKADAQAACSRIEAKKQDCSIFAPK
jgi:D-alanyl-D-alanine carboxypeptidase